MWLLTSFMVMQLSFKWLNENTLKVIINLKLQQSYHLHYRHLYLISHVHVFYTCMYLRSLMNDHLGYDDNYVCVVFDIKRYVSGIQGRNLMPTAPPDVATCAGCVYSHPA